MYPHYKYQNTPIQGGWFDDSLGVDLKDSDFYKRTKPPFV